MNISIDRRWITVMCAALMVGALYGAVVRSVEAPVVVAGPGLKSEMRFDRCALIVGDARPESCEVCLLGMKTSAVRRASIVAITFGESGKMFATRLIADVCANPDVLAAGVGTGMSDFDDGERQWTFSTNTAGIPSVGWRMKAGHPTRSAFILHKDVLDCNPGFLPEMDGLPLVREKDGIPVSRGAGDAVKRSLYKGVSVKELRERFAKEDELQKEASNRPRARMALYYDGGERFRTECLIVSPQGETMGRASVTGRIDFERCELSGVRQWESEGGAAIQLSPRCISVGSGDVVTTGIRFRIEFEKHGYVTDFLIR